MADRRVFISSVSLVSIVLVFAFKTVRFCTDLQYRTYVPMEHITSEEKCEIGLQYERFSIDYSTLRNRVERARSWTCFAAFNFSKENQSSGRFGYYWSRPFSQISCIFEYRNRRFDQEIQQNITESKFKFEVLFSQAKRLQTCVSFQLVICILYKHVIKYERINCKRLKSRIQYYSNSVATFQLLIACGDVQTNPGPFTSELSTTSKQNYTHVKISQLVTSLQTSRQQDVFALLVPSCQQVVPNLLTTCNKLDENIRLVTRLF